MAYKGLDIRKEWSNGNPLVLYGAGGAGRTVARELMSRGIKPLAFLDARVSAGDMREGIPAFNLKEWRDRNGSENVDVLISIHSPVSVAEVVDTLRAIGFSRVFTMVDYVNAFPDDLNYRYWLVPSAYYEDKQAQIAAARKLFSDPVSLNWFDATVKLRQDGDYHGLPEPLPAEQYMPADLPRWPGKLRLIDCGAFDGDSIQAFLDADYEIEALIAFEPEPANYNKLSTRFTDLNAMFLPCGVFSGTTQLNFEGGVGVSSKVEKTGTTTVQCLSMDEALPLFGPTLIKMDIEGSELAALHGAENVLRRYKPGLAISIYHQPEHLWEIALWIAQLEIGYNMSLRCHNHCGYDLVLYCRVN